MDFEVSVSYPAAEEPFKRDFAGTDSLAQVRMAAMNAFGLSDGQLPDGSTVTYVLFFRKAKQEDLSKTLEQLASETEGRERHLEFKLSQQVTQG
jgi:hypothetical protein